MRAGLFAEFLKVRRSTVAAIVSGLIVLFVPVIAYSLFWVSVNGGFGALAVKTDGLIVGEGWDGYMSAAGQISAVSVFLGVGVAAAWMFGREYVDRTFPSLFGQAVSRSEIAYAKFVVAAVWSMAVVVAMVGVIGLVGVVTSVEPGTESVGSQLLGLGVLSGIAALLGLTTAIVATVGRGYLPAIGALIVVVALGQMAVLFGTGAWFPYAVPGLLAADGLEGVPGVSAVHLLPVVLLIGVVVSVTARIWDQSEAV